MHIAGEPMLQEFAEELRQTEEAEAAERARADALETELAAAQQRLAELQAGSTELNALEERYWHDFNDFQGQLRAHVEERDALLGKVRGQHAAFRCD